MYQKNWAIVIFTLGLMFLVSDLTHHLWSPLIIGIGALGVGTIVVSGGNGSNDEVDEIETTRRRQELSSGRAWGYDEVDEVDEVETTRHRQELPGEGTRRYDEDDRTLRYRKKRNDQQ